MSTHTIARIWRGVVVIAILAGSEFFALADLSGFPLAGYDDTLLHFAAFFGMTWLFVSAYPHVSLAQLLFALGLLAGATELLQFLPGTNRQPD